MEISLLLSLSLIGEAFPDNKNWTDTFAGHLLEIKSAVENARAELLTTLDDSLQTDFIDRYDSILADAEQAVRGSPVGKNKFLSAPSLHRRLIRNKELILRFMTDFSVPFDNNGSERDLRILKLQQKISGCFRSAAGVAVFCRVRSYLSSARKQGRGLLTSLEHALRGKPTALTS